MWTEGANKMRRIDDTIHTTATATAADACAGRSVTCHPSHASSLSLRAPPPALGRLRVLQRMILKATKLKYHPAPTNPPFLSPRGTLPDQATSSWLGWATFVTDPTSHTMRLQTRERPPFTRARPGNRWVARESRFIRTERKG